GAQTNHTPHPWLPAPAHEKARHPKVDPPPDTPFHKPAPYSLRVMKSGGFGTRLHWVSKPPEQEKEGGRRFRSLRVLFQNDGTPQNRIMAL
ncbi:hypothetical protein ABG768_013054, partial [Culter alburnus]